MYCTNGDLLPKLTTTRQVMSFLTYLIFNLGRKDETLLEMERSVSCTKVIMQLFSFHCYFPLSGHTTAAPSHETHENDFIAPFSLGKRSCFALQFSLRHENYKKDLRQPGGYAFVFKHYYPTACLFDACCGSFRNSGDGGPDIKCSHPTVRVLAKMTSASEGFRNVSVDA
jgi:hypothetical protein